MNRRAGFQWTPGAIKSLAWELAIEDDRHHLARHSQFVLDGYERQARRYLNIAAAHMQPVVALPPCPTCKGEGRRPGYRMGANGCNDPRYVCPACNGSGVDRLIPESEIRTLAAEWESYGDPAGEGLSRWLDEQGAR